MTITNLTGIVRFKVAGQEALSKWAQQALRNALKTTDAPPESLRFQCRIATDARENFNGLQLSDGSSLTVHPKSKPQFGKNRDGLAFLTVTVIHSLDGESYRLQWLGDKVPRKMQEVAVKHDLGLAAKSCTIGLDLASAVVTPSKNTRLSANGEIIPASARKTTNAQKRAWEARKKRGEVAPRQCARLTAGDL